jgi:hypothetical protein
MVNVSAIATTSQNGLSAVLEKYFSASRGARKPEHHTMAAVGFRLVPNLRLGHVIAKRNERTIVLSSVLALASVNATNLGRA